MALFLFRNRLGKGPLAAVLCYCGILFPALGFANIYFTRFSFVADHFQYHASIPLLAFLAAVVVRVVPQIERRSLPALAVIVPLLLLLGSLTFSRCAVYRDSMTLWTDTLEKNPAAWMAHTNLANLLDARGRSREGLWHHGRAAELNPLDPLSYLNLGGAQLRSGNLQAAISTFERGLECPMLRPVDRAKLENSLGSARFIVGDLDRAILHLRRAIIDNPDLADAHSNLGTALAFGGFSEEAIGELRTALRLNPNDAETRAALNQLTRGGGSRGEPR